MPTRIFKDIFKNKPLPQKIHSTFNLKSASGDSLTQYGTFMLQMTIRGKTYSHPVITWTIAFWALISSTNTRSAMTLQKTNSVGSAVCSNNSCDKTNHCSSSVIKDCQNTLCWYPIARSKFRRNHWSTTAQHNLGYATVGLNQQRQNLFNCHWQLCTIWRHNWSWRHFGRRGNGNRRSNTIGWKLYQLFKFQDWTRSIQRKICNEPTSNHGPT